MRTTKFQKVRFLTMRPNNSLSSAMVLHSTTDLNVTKCVSVNGDALKVNS